jgi:hypothetical protein
MAYGEENYGYRIGQIVESREYNDGEWEIGVVTELFHREDDEPVKVLSFDGSDYAGWRSLRNIRPYEDVAAREGKRLRVRLNTLGPAFARKTGEWQTLEIGEIETCIAIPPSAHQQQVVLRYAPPRTEAEILAAIRQRVESPLANVSRLELAKLLKGEF